MKQGKVELKDVFTYCLGSVSYPLSSGDGSIAKTSKSAIVGLVKRTWPQVEATDIPPRGAVIIDIMCMIHAFAPTHLPRTFKEFASSLLTKVSFMANHWKAKRVDLIFDTYPNISIKIFEHGRRGGNAGLHSSNIRRIVNGEQNMPKQWKEFLRYGPNKEQLASFFFHEWINDPVSFEFSVKHRDTCYNLQIGHVSEVSLLECDHVEADTCLFLHCKHASETHSTVILSSCDSDVFVIGLCPAKNIPSILFLEMGKSAKGSYFVF